MNIEAKHFDQSVTKCGTLQTLGKHFCCEEIAFCGFSHLKHVFWELQEIIY